MTQEEKNTIKKAFGNHYTKPIVEHLKSKQITKPTGNNYTAIDIRQIFYGVRPNPEIEITMLKLAKSKISKNQKLFNSKIMLLQ